MNPASVPVSKQSRKHAIGLAGEFLVAGELLRRGVMAAVTYGNAKKADVVAFQEGLATALEVKTTSEPKWILGGSLPDESSSLWVLVHLPSRQEEPPDYFVLTSAELRKLILPQHNAYNERYRQKHGREFSSKGVVSIQRSLLDERHRGAWQKIEKAISGEQ